MASPHRRFRRSCNRPVLLVFLVALFFLMIAKWSELFYGLLKRANKSIDMYNKIELEQFYYEDRNLTKKSEYNSTTKNQTNRIIHHKDHEQRKTNAAITIKGRHPTKRNISIKYTDLAKIDRLAKANGCINYDKLDEANEPIVKHINEDRNITKISSTNSKISSNESFWIIPTSRKGYKGVGLSPFMKNFHEYPRLDFAVIGFAKCGTTSLQHWFAKKFQRYVSMLPGEGGPPEPTVGINDVKGKRFFTSLCRLPCNKLHALKNPALEYLTLGPVQRYSSHFRLQKRPIKFIIGLRHPVSLFQSFYNYRSKETEIAKWVSNELKVKGLPHPKKLIGFQNSVFDVNTDYSRFDIMLMGLGKVNLTQDDVDLFFEAKRNLRRGMFATDLDSYMFEDIGGPVFIYDIHQLRDPNMTRRQEFQLDLMRFLGIDAMIKLDTNSSVFEIPDFPMDNANKGNNRVHETKVNARNKTLRINICDEDFREVRELILENGKRTSSWILDRFLGSPDVFVGGSGYFQEQVKNYGIDFC